MCVVEDTAKANVHNIMNFYLQEYSSLHSRCLTMDTPGLQAIST